jgi:hypothetical protein
LLAALKTSHGKKRGSFSNYLHENKVFVGEACRLDRGGEISAADPRIADRRASRLLASSTDLKGEEK